jgi:uncharacterized protein (TIGR00255 family)
MTGFGSASDQNFSIDIRSLNHRFIDISIKMPPFMHEHEIPLRNILKEHFARGRFDVFISLNEQKQQQVRWNRARLQNLLTALQDIQKEFALPGRITIHTLSEYRDMLGEEEVSYDTDALFGLFRAAVGSLREMRISEGNLLSGEIRRRTATLRTMLDTIKAQAPDELVRWREKLTARLRLILDAGTIDAGKILQEAGIMAEKLDIAEELSRIENHLVHCGEILDTGDTMGRKLDFILQELNREVNTLGYKSAEYAISAVVVEMKTELEKMREQVQNIQ